MNIASSLRTPEHPFTACMDDMASRPRSVTTPAAPPDAERARGDARPFWLRRTGVGADASAGATAGTPSILLIDAVERRIRRLGHEPVRTFDAQRRWRLEAAGMVIAEGRSLDELARAAHAWLEARAGMR